MAEKMRIPVRGMNGRKTFQGYFGNFSDSEHPFLVRQNIPSNAAVYSSIE